MNKSHIFMKDGLKQMGRIDSIAAILFSKAVGNSYKLVTHVVNCFTFNLIAKIKQFDKKKAATPAFLHCHGLFLTLF